MPSSVVASMSYDPKSASLLITFVSGMVYKYLNVPEKVYRAMKTAGSKGAFLNTEIKRKYRFIKVK